MRIAVVPASTRTGTAAIHALLELSSPNESIGVKAYYRDTSKAPADITSHASVEIVQGDVLDASSLDFEECDAIFAVPPPFFTHEDMIARSEKAAESVKTAIEKASSVKRLVLLSSQGAHLYDGVGEVKTKTAAERILRTARLPQITIIRPAYFMENWLATLKHLDDQTSSFTTYITPLDWKIPMVAIRDVGRAAAHALTSDSFQSSQLYVHELHGPKPEGYSPLDVRNAFVKAVGKDDVEIQTVEKDGLEAMFLTFLPKGCVAEFVEMVTSFLPGGVLDLNPDPEAVVIRGETNLEEAIGKAIRASG